MENVLADRGPLRLRRPARLLRLTSDERLVALVRDGDEGAFEALYDRHHAAILGFCRHMLGTREEAEDAVQHTFLAAFRELAGSDKAIDLRPWLYAIARNRCLSLLRARRTHVAIELAEPATDGLAATVERREDLRELLADLACLPEDQRAALLLAEMGALDHAGIAAVLGCPRERVKALVFQARTSLAASREARATPCEEIRMELATASGAALRRGPLRRHLRSCDGCRAFKAEVAAQRKLLGLALPVVPSVALKASVFGGGASTSSGLLAATASTGAGKIAVSLAAAGAIAGGGALTAQLEQRNPAPATSAPSRAGTLHAAPAPASPQPTSARPHRGATVRLPAGGASPAVPGQRRQPPGTQPAGASGAVMPAHPGTTSQAPPAPAPTLPHQPHGAQTAAPTGQATSPPGRSRTPPGQAKPPPGQAKPPPGQAKPPPGQSGAAPAARSHPGGGPPAGVPSGGQPAGQAGDAGNGSPPAHAGAAPGQSGAPHGNAG